MGSSVCPPPHSMITEQKFPVKYQWNYYEMVLPKPNLQVIQNNYPERSYKIKTHSLLAQVSIQVHQKGIKFMSLDLDYDWKGSRNPLGSFVVAVTKKLPTRQKVSDMYAFREDCFKKGHYCLLQHYTHLWRNFHYLQDPAARDASGYPKKGLDQAHNCRSQIIEDFVYFNGIHKVKRITDYHSAFSH